MRIIGHRGCMGEGYPPENTLKAFRFALDHGADGIEIDVHLSCDKWLVIFHDSTLKRMAARGGHISKRTLKHLQGLDIHGEKIPTLREALDLVETYLPKRPELIVNIELKGHGTVAPVCDIITEYCKRPGWSHKNFIVSSFNFNKLIEAHACDPKLPIGALWCDSVLGFSPHEIIETLGFTPYSIHPVPYLIDEPYIQAATAKKIKIICWSLEKTPYRYRKAKILALQELKALAVFGVITNWPEKRVIEIQ
jgi:glycerophosphoryl diester phosphodiesterase